MKYLLEYCTPRQHEIVSAVIETGSMHKAARAVGVNPAYISRLVAAVKKKAAMSGVSPEHDLTHAIAPGQVLRGASTLYKRGEPEPVLQWVKTRRDDQLCEIIREEILTNLTETIRREPKRAAPKRVLTDLLNTYVITDYHLGMMSWHEETGADWDTKIAEELLVKWFSTAIVAAPDAHTGVLAQLGDFLHWDGMDAVTPASKHLLDADTRFQKLVAVAIRALRRVINLLLDKHKRVVVIMAEGNHDPASSIWLREAFTVLYENNARVRIERSPDPYYCIEHGETAVFFHHGHKRKPVKVDTVFAAKFREVFGRTKNNYAHLGHMHHNQLLETNLMHVEQHRTLAAPDAYASRGGWISGRDAKVITYHKKHGEVSRVIIGVNAV